MKKVLFISGACALLCAVVVSGSSLLSLHSTAQFKATVARLQAEGFPKKATDLLAKTDATQTVAPAAGSATPLAATSSEPVAAFLLDEKNWVAEIDGLFDLSSRMLEWTDGEKERVRSLLALNADLLSKLKAVLPQPRASLRFLYAMTGFDGPMDPAVFNGRRWAPAFLLLEFDSCLAYGEGRFDEALDDYTLMLQLDYHLRGFPLHGNLPLFFWEHTPGQLALTLRNGRFSGDVLRDFESVLEQVDGYEDMARGVQENVLLAQRMFEDPQRIMKEVQRAMDVGIFMRALGVAYASPLCDFKRQMDEALFLEMHRREMPLLRAPYCQIREQAEAYKKDYSAMTIEKPPFLRTRAEDTVSDIIAQAGFETCLTQACIAAALNRYHAKTGEYPDSLDSLSPDFLPQIPKDPFSGQPMHYQRGENDYVIFSAGENGVYDMKMEGKERTRQRTVGGASIWPADDKVWGVHSGRPFVS